jgi:DNA repair exonuclease SbcCD ATPase subunit
MKTNKTFESWYTMIMEGELATATVTETPTISNDVDTIITSLETLAKELTEELEGEDFTEINEADAEGPSVVMQWLWWMPKARKAQAKVNKIKLNVTDMEAAATDAPDAEQKAKIAAKAKQAKEQAAELQKMVDDKFKSKGDLVGKAIHNEKIAGQIASIKRASGLEDDPEKLSTYKEKMAELQQKYKEDQEAIKELEPSDEDKKAEKAKRDKEEAEAKAAQDKLNADAQAAKDKKAGKTEGGEDEEAEAPEETPEEKTAREEKEAAADKAEKIKSLNAEITELGNKLKEAGDADTKDEEAINALNTELTAKKKELAALEAPEKTVEDSLVIRAKAAGLNELATEIESKFDWQVSEGTALHSKYNELIKKAEYSNTLNESKYQNLSVKERFSRLM